MGFFKDFKDDLSDAVDELIPGSEEDGDGAAAPAVALTPETLEADINVEDELSKLDGLLEKASANIDNDAGNKQAEAESGSSEAAPVEAPNKPHPVETTDKETVMDTTTNDNTATEPVETNVKEQSKPPVFETQPASDENAVITSGMKITGDLESTGSIEVEGTIRGNVRCNGKLTVTGLIEGNSTASEFFADSARVQGEIITSGTVKIGVGSIVIGNISATSAVIAGAVKGDIDVQGPVVVDTSAVVMGNIKSRSVQINNGAVIEGFCSQAYAEVDVNSVFG